MKNQVLKLHTVDVILYKVDKRNGTGFATVVELLLLQERQDKKYDEWQRI